MANVRVISITKPTKDFANETGAQNVQDIISYAARVSNQKNQDKFDTANKLLKYCADNKHWSVFEQGSATLEIETTRTISHQIVRHRSFCFQEFSQRYSEIDVNSFEITEARLQDAKNRQSSIEVNDTYLQEVWEHKQQNVIDASVEAYDWAIQNGMAKEVARCVLPEGLTPSKLYMSGSIRSWIHYISVRTDLGTQKEHREIAQMCYEALVTELPILASMVQPPTEKIIWHKRILNKVKLWF